MDNIKDDKNGEQQKIIQVCWQGMTEWQQTIV